MSDRLRAQAPNPYLREQLWVPGRFHASNHLVSVPNTPSPDLISLLLASQEENIVL